MIVQIDVWAAVDSDEWLRCFRGSSVESYYVYSNDTKGYYYLSNFDNILIAGGERTTVPSGHLILCLNI